MPPLRPVKRKELIRRLRRLGFVGPHSGGKHEYMVKGNLRLALPNPHQGDIGVGSFLNIMPNGDVFPCHVLTQREFRCGNVREQSLLEICRRSGLLGHLQASDFREMARQDERLLPLIQPNTCMGNVYASTKSLPVWSDNLPMFNRCYRK